MGESVLNNSLQLLSYRTAVAFLCIMRCCTWIATAENGWHAIVVNAQIGWVSGKYSQIV